MSSIVDGSKYDTLDVSPDGAATNGRGATDSRSMPAFAGASPAVPRDPRLLEAERADYAAKMAAEEARAAKVAAADASARAAAARAAADQSRAELENAREEARAMARAAALQVRLEHEENRQVDQTRIVVRSDREERLGSVRAVAPEPEIRYVEVTTRDVDRPMASIGLLVTRLVFAGFISITGWQSMVNGAAAGEMLTKIGLSGLVFDGVGHLVGISLIAVAVLIALGVGTRILSGLLFATTAVFLAFFRFGPFSPFIEGQFGFYGDREVLLAGIAALLTLIGGGGWSVDSRLRRRRDAARDEEQI